jgi:hypothetical protein
MSAFAWIKLAAAPENAFSKVFFSPGQDVADVADLACKAFRHWALDARQVRIHLVAQSGEEPGDEAIQAALATKRLAVSAVVAAGAWLVAAHLHSRAPPTSALAPGRLICGGGGGGNYGGGGGGVGGGSGGGSGGGGGSGAGSGGSGGGGGGGGGSAAEGRASPTLPAAKLPSVSEVVGPTFEGEARDIVSALFRELCPWATDRSPLLSRTLNRGGNQREADVMCYVEGDSLAPCAALAASGACLVGLPGPALPALPSMPLPPGRRFSPTDGSRKGPHKYFLAGVYCGPKAKVWTEKTVQLETLCQRLRIRWQDQHAGLEGLPPVTDVTQVVGAAALIFSAGDGARLDVLGEAQQRVARSIAAQCPNLARLAAAGRLLLIVLDKAQAPSTFVQRSVSVHLERLRGVPEDLAGLRREMAELARGMAELAASVRSLRK